MLAMLATLLSVLFGIKPQQMMFETVSFLFYSFLREQDLAVSVLQINIPGRFSCCSLSSAGLEGKPEVSDPF